MTDYNPYQTPDSSLGSGYAAPAIALAGRGQRLLAVLINGLLASVVGSPFYYAMFSGMNLSELGTNPNAVWAMYGRGFSSGLGLLGLALVLAFLAYQGYIYANTGQTLGKKWMGVRVVRSNGSKVDGARLIGLREIVPVLIAFIPCLGSIFSLVDPLCIFRSTQQTLHDQMADTIVVQA